MSNVKVYVENRVLDLFDDEQIVITSTGQQLTDLSGLVTDYTQTFTVPATKNNNAIFEYYFNNDVNPTIDQNLRREARIEVNDMPFRSGKLQLQKSVVENGQGQNYTADFFGEVVTLKDLFGEDKISELDYTALGHEYNATQVLNRINGTTFDDVKYPLISSSRLWDVTGGSPNDITSGAGSILFTELFPAIRMNRIRKLIEGKYGIAFSGAWLLSKKWTEFYMWFKNKEVMGFISAPTKLTNSTTTLFPNGYIFNELQYYYADPSTFPTAGGSTIINIKHSAFVSVTTASTSPYYLDVYKSGYLISSLQCNGGNFTFNIVAEQSNNPSLDENYTFFIRSTVAATFNGSINYKRHWTELTAGFPTQFTQTYSNAFNSVTSTIQIDFANLAPDMKVLDFVKGMLGICNGTLIGTSPTKYEVKPLNEYFNAGTYYDITRYVDEKSIEYNRPPLYKNISLEYQESKSIINRDFYDLFTRNFANLTNSFDYDGSDYKISLPFETLLGQKFTGTDLQVAYCIDNNKKSYIPKPVVLYALPPQSGVYFRYETSTAVSQYIPFGQDITDNLEDYTSCWGLEVSSFYLTSKSNGLYRTYYEDYISNLYNPKTRLVKLKTNMPLRLLKNIKLNSKLIIRDKTYIIVDQKTNLSTGDVDFTLLSWWIPSDFNKTIRFDASAQSGKITFDVGESSLDITDKDGTPFGTLSPLTGTGVFQTTATVTDNDTGLFRSLYYNYTITSLTGEVRSGIIEIAQEA